MNAIVLAAGQGTRLAPYTLDRPKCMVEISGKPIIGRVIHSLRQGGVDDIVIVRGYMSDMLEIEGVRTCQNPDYATTNMLWSLFCAENELQDGFIFTFADIIYGPSLVRKLLDAPADIALVCDSNWSEVYEGRTAHTVGEANLVKTTENSIVSIGRGMIPLDEVTGEFIGLGKGTGSAVGELISIYHDVRSQWLSGEPLDFHNVDDFRTAYLDDIFQEMINRGQNIYPVITDVDWHEVDTPQDIERVSSLLAKTGELE